MAKKDSFYFPHDSNAHNDEKCLYIISKYGMEGYGLYWCWIEAMHEQADGKLTIKLIEGLSLRYNVDKGLLLAFYNDAIDIELFATDGVKYWSERVLRNKEIRDEKRCKLSNAGKAGMQSRWGSNSDVITTHNNVITKNNKGKEIKGKESKGKEIFIPPSKNEVFNEMVKKIDINLATLESEKFINFYESKNFFIGKNKMRNWKAAAAGWVNRINDFKNNKNGTYQQLPGTGKVTKSTGAEELVRDLKKHITSYQHS